ncbi:MAG: hypothetical protein ACLR6J_07270 [Parabacteroides merdae]
MKEEITVGFGGNISSYQANQLFLGLGYQYLRRYAADVNANFQARQLVQWRDVETAVSICRREYRTYLKFGKAYSQTKILRKPVFVLRRRTTGFHPPERIVHEGQVRIPIPESP